MIHLEYHEREYDCVGKLFRYNLCIEILNWDVLLHEIEEESTIKYKLK